MVRCVRRVRWVHQLRCVRCVRLVRRERALGHQSSHPPHPVPNPLHLAHPAHLDPAVAKAMSPVETMANREETLR